MNSIVYKTSINNTICLNTNINILDPNEKNLFVFNSNLLNTTHIAEYFNNDIYLLQNDVGNILKLKKLMTNMTFLDVLTIGTKTWKSAYLLKYNTELIIITVDELEFSYYRFNGTIITDSKTIPLPSGKKIEQAYIYNNEIFVIVNNALIKFSLGSIPQKIEQTKNYYGANISTYNNDLYIYLPDIHSLYKIIQDKLYHMFQDTTISKSISKSSLIEHNGLLYIAIGHQYGSKIIQFDGNISQTVNWNIHSNILGNSCSFNFYKINNELYLFINNNLFFDRLYNIKDMKTSLGYISTTNIYWNYI